MKKRCVIVGGAGIRHYEAVRQYLQPDDFIVCCDSGLKHRDGLGIVPDLIIGDFDSWEDPHLAVETIVLPREKDDTDTMAAVREAVRRGFDRFLLLGVFGDRLDHTLANVYLLTWLDNRGKQAMAVDDFSEMEIVSRNPAYIEDRFPFFSLLNISGLAEGVTIKNAGYPLENAAVSGEYQYAVSNQPLPGMTAEVTVKKGSLLLIRDR
ncbi:MAG: thiamine diphosphokinase [Flexilinea sp.]|nr:thiamine diphosphokinase [Flexilinea sp.]